MPPALPLTRLWALVGIVLILTGCGTPQPDQDSRESQEKPNVTAAAQTFDPEDGMPDIAEGAPILAEIPTPAPATMYDEDGDGFTDTRSIVQSVDDSWVAFVFPPGYQFAIERFRTDWASEVVSNDRRYQNRYNYTIIVMAQTCAWIQYWLDAQASGDTAAAEEAALFLIEVFPNTFIYSSMSDTMLNLGHGAALGDVPKVQEYFDSLLCTEKYFRPTWSGPQNRLLPLPESPKVGNNPVLSRVATPSVPPWRIAR